MKFNGPVKIIERKQLLQDIFQITVERPKMINSILPGQFFNIVTTKTGYPLLRRPISVSGFCADTIEFTVKVLGASPAVGSSSINTSGFMARTPAIATRLF